MSAARIEEADPADPRASAALAAYFAELAHLFPEGFDPARSHHPDDAALRHPNGTFLLALIGQEVVGCLAVKGAEDFAEIKRLWVAPVARGTGLAKALMERAAVIARELGYPLLRLDTNRALTGPIAMYRAWGWREIERFNADPYAHLFFEKGA